MFYSMPPTHERYASNSFCLYKLDHILHIVLKWLVGTRGARFSAAQNFRATNYFSTKGIKDRYEVLQHQPPK